VCGIAGFIDRSRDDQTAVLERMMKRIEHRGPDGSGTWFERFADWGVGFGHRRLSIIDVEGGKQPLGNDDQSVQITYNGEVYNFRDLRAPLEAKGHRFATQSDTEVIVHHVEEFGVEGLKDLNGMFAFGIWDHGKKTLLLARDRAGIKPLFYAKLQNGGVAFASELTALLQHPGVSRKLSKTAISSYFFSDYVLHPESWIEGVNKLEPGHYVQWQNGALGQPVSFWNFPGEAKDDPARTDNDVIAVLGHKLDAAVERQMISDVPLGVFLSGGLDSSIVAAIAARHSSRPLTTFSIAFEDPTFDESGFAREVAKHIGSDHVEQMLNEPVLVDSTQAALDCLDEPVADPSIVPTYLLSRLASQQVKVALGGDGGDELWAGYPTYLAHQYSRYYETLPQFVRDSMISPLVAALPTSDRYQSLEWKAKRFTERWDSDDQTRHLRWMSNTDLPDLKQISAHAFQNPRTLELRAPENIRDKTNLQLALDFRTYLVGSVLAKVDRAAMAHGLEVRPPLLDNDLIDFAFSLASSFKLRGGVGKYLLKRAAERLLPEHIIYRAKKGFAIPLSRWLRGPFRPMVESVLSASPLWSGMLRRDTFQTWNREHQERKRDRSRPLWALIVLDRWVKREGLHVG